MKKWKVWNYVGDGAGKGVDWHAGKRGEARLMIPEIKTKNKQQSAMHYITWRTELCAGMFMVVTAHCQVRHLTGLISNFSKTNSVFITESRSKVYLALQRNTHAKELSPSYTWQGAYHAYLENGKQSRAFGVEEEKEATSRYWKKTRRENLEYAK